MKNLAELIRKNPGAVFTVDNDDWWMNPPRPDGMTDEAHDEWQETVLADAGSVAPNGAGYGSGNCYGGDILQALAEIVGVKVESV